MRFKQCGPNDVLAPSHAGSSRYQPHHLRIPLARAARPTHRPRPGRSHRNLHQRRHPLRTRRHPQPSQVREENCRCCFFSSTTSLALCRPLHPRRTLRPPTPCARSRRRCRHRNRHRRTSRLPHHRRQAPSLRRNLRRRPDHPPPASSIVGGPQHNRPAFARKGDSRIGKTALNSSPTKSSNSSQKLPCQYQRFNENNKSPIITSLSLIIIVDTVTLQNL